MAEDTGKLVCTEPDYFKDFFCEGKRCGAQCCGGWTVFVDEDTYARYEALPEHERKVILPHIAKCPEGSGESAYMLDFGDGGRCPLLRDDQLCSIQRRLGEEYLGNTCALYPRKIVHIGWFYERFLFLSCPLAAELALLRDDHIQFEKHELSRVRTAGWVDTAQGKEGEGMAAAFWLLQDTGIVLLQDRKHTLKERMAYLLGFLERADETVAEGDIGKLIALSEKYKAGSGVPRALPVCSDEWMAGLRARLDPIEQSNSHAEMMHEVPTARTVPPMDILMENIVVSEFFIGLYPCCLPGSMLHNGMVLYVISEIFHSKVEQASEHGDASRLLLELSRQMIYANHDRDWLQAVSEYLTE